MLKDDKKNSHQIIEARFNQAHIRTNRRCKVSAETKVVEKVTDNIFANRLKGPPSPSILSVTGDHVVDGVIFRDNEETTGCYGNKSSTNKIDVWCVVIILCV